MTLSTNIYILDPVDPHEVFDFCNKYLLRVTNPATKDAPSQSFNRETREWVDDPDIMDLDNEPGQGFDAWLLTKYRKSGKPLYIEDNFEEDYLSDPACFMKLDFDTAYGYRNPTIGGCSELHARYIIALHDWLSSKNVRIKWQNEFTGEYFDGLDGLEEFSADGAKAHDWFKSILPGIILSSLSEEKES